jgi:AcrR family transcriptional regulator
MPRLTRDEQRSRTRASLIDAAASVFARRGFNGASLDEIAQEAGFTKGAVYSNFASKDDLFLAVLEEHLSERIGEVRAAFAEIGSLRDVRAGGRAVAHRVDTDRDLWLLFMEVWNRAAREPEVRARIAGLYEAWREAVGRLIEARFEEVGVPLPAPPEDLAAATIALAEGHALQRLIDPDRVGDETYGDMLAYLIAGMAVAGLDLDIDALDRLRAEAGR